MAANRGMVAGSHNRNEFIMIRHDGDAPAPALKVDPSDGKMLASRSRCWLQLGYGQKALEDATRCKKRCPEWAEARLLRGQALMLLKDYEKACEELSGGVELDPENDEMDKLFWEAMELKMK